MACTVSVFACVQTWLWHELVSFLTHYSHRVALPNNVGICEIVYGQQNTKPSLWVLGQLPASDGHFSLSPSLFSKILWPLFLVVSTSSLLPHLYLVSPFFLCPSSLRSHSSLQISSESHWEQISSLALPLHSPGPLRACWGLKFSSLALSYWCLQEIW